MNQLWSAFPAAWIPRCFCAWRMTCSAIAARLSSRFRPPWRKVSSGPRWTWRAAWACAARSSIRTSYRVLSSSPIPRIVATIASRIAHHRGPGGPTPRLQGHHAWHQCGRSGDYRPRLQAAKDHGAHHPLLDAGLNKQEIRELSKQLGLSTWDNHSSPACRRVSLTAPHYPERLRQVDAFEEVCAPWASGNCACAFTTKSHAWKSNLTPCRAHWSCARLWSSLVASWDHLRGLGPGGSPPARFNQLIGIRRAPAPQNKMGT